MPSSLKAVSRAWLCQKELSNKVSTAGEVLQLRGWGEINQRGRWRRVGVLKRTLSKKASFGPQNKSNLSNVSFLSHCASGFWFNSTCSISILLLNDINEYYLSAAGSRDLPLLGDTVSA